MEAITGIYEFHVITHITYVLSVLTRGSEIRKCVRTGTGILFMQRGNRLDLHVRLNNHVIYRNRHKPYVLLCY